MHSDMHKKRVLIVDDEMEMRVFLSRLLKQGGYKPVLAANASDGMRKATEVPMDLIVLNMMIPQEGGARFYQWIKKNDQLQSVPVIMLSTIDLETFQHYQKIHGFQPGICMPKPEAYLLKPPEADEFMDFVRELTCWESSREV